MGSELCNLGDGGNFFRRLSGSETYPVMTWRHGNRGWRRLISFGPLAAYRYYGSGPLQLAEFAGEYRNCLIVGYLGFELGYKLLNISPGRNVDPGLPLAEFRAYPNYMEFSNQQCRLHFQDPAFPGLVCEISGRRLPGPEGFSDIVFHLAITREEYEKRLRRIFSYIRAGDIYQVNFTHRLKGRTHMPPRELFLQLLKINPVSYACFMESESAAILSFSPELFISIKNGHIITEPIKGTRPRGRDLAADKSYLSALLNSSKEQAELFMITDLLRNDLGKISKIGSVRLLKKKAVRRLPQIFHTYSRIAAELQPGLSPIKALLSMFPGGSISGCPKYRAMEIISELEDTPRGIYTGAIGYILPDGELEFNLAIRTIVQKDRRLLLGTGGGITIDSDIQAEFKEALSKAGSFGVVVE